MVLTWERRSIKKERTGNENSFESLKTLFLTEFIILQGPTESILFGLFDL